MVETSVTIFGRLTKNPDLYNDGPSPRCNFRVASTERRFDRKSGEWVDGNTVFISVTCWRTLAENVRASVGKGDAVVVTGRLHQRSYVNDKEVSITLTEIDADVVAVDLRKGETNRVRKVVRQAGFDASFDTARPEHADVRPEDAMAGLDGDAVSASELRSLVEGELVGSVAEPPF